MRRADRLFRLIQLLRGQRGVTTAQMIAEALEVSVRTVYRDVADLVGSGVPIEGEPGVGYLLRSGYDLPPLMFEVEEIEAIVLGAQIISSWGDPALAAAAERALDKVEAVLPDRLRRELLDTALFAPPSRMRMPFSADLAALRRAVRARTKVHLHYADEQGRRSERVVRPLGLAFYGPVWLLLAWCELRVDFRAFRVDRMATATVLQDTFKDERGKGILDYLKRSKAPTSRSCASAAVEPPSCSGIAGPGDLMQGAGRCKSGAPTCRTI